MKLNLFFLCMLLMLSSCSSTPEREALDTLAALSQKSLQFQHESQFDRETGEKIAALLARYKQGNQRPHALLPKDYVSYNASEVSALTMPVDAKLLDTLLNEGKPFWTPEALRQAEIFNEDGYAIAKVENGGNIYWLTLLKEAGGATLVSVSKSETGARQEGKAFPEQILQESLGDQRAECARQLLLDQARKLEISNVKAVWGKENGRSRRELTFQTHNVGSFPIERAAYIIRIQNPEGKTVFMEDVVDSFVYEPGKTYLRKLSLGDDSMLFSAKDGFEDDKDYHVYSRLAFAKAVDGSYAICAAASEVRLEGQSLLWGNDVLREAVPDDGRGYPMPALLACSDGSCTYKGERIVPEPMTDSFNSESYLHNITQEKAVQLAYLRELAQKNRATAQEIFGKLTLEVKPKQSGQPPQGIANAVTVSLHNASGKVLNNAQVSLVYKTSTGIMDTFTLTMPGPIGNGETKITTVKRPRTALSDTAMPLQAAIVGCELAGVVIDPEGEYLLPAFLR